MKKSTSTANKLAPLLTLILFFGIWEFGVRLTHTPNWLLPPPSQVVLALLSSRELLWHHTLLTLGEALLGFALSMILALLIAFIMDQVLWVREAFYPLIIFSQTIPLLILAVLFTIWFGFGMLPKILVVILVCFFPIIISLMNGLDEVDPDLIKLFRSMGAKRLQIFRMVKLPLAMPGFFSGLRISATYSLMAAVIGEWMGAEKGLGYFMTLMQKSYRIDQVLAAVVIICLMSYLLVKSVDLAEYLVLPWNRVRYDEQL